MLRSLRVGCGVSVAILVTISEPLAPVVPDASGDVSHPTLCFSSHASHCAHWTLAWHGVPGICILTMTSLNYSHVHEPLVQAGVENNFSAVQWQSSLWRAERASISLVFYSP